MNKFLTGPWRVPSVQVVEGKGSPDIHVIGHMGTPSEHDRHD